jgi:hypothetical protein
MNFDLIKYIHISAVRCQAKNKRKGQQKWILIRYVEKETRSLQANPVKPQIEIKKRNVAVGFLGNFFGANIWPLEP